MPTHCSLLCGYPRRRSGLGRHSMELRRISPRESRRRRVLVDESLRSGVPTEARTRKRQAPRYRPEALDLVNRPLGALIPVRPYWLNVIALSGLVAIFALVDLDLACSSGVWYFHREVLQPLRVANASSLASWLSSLLLLVAAVYAMLIYSMRCHRMDDYRGRYRIWVSGILLLAIGSMDQVTGVARGLLAACQDLPSAHSGAQLAWWLPIAVPALQAIPALRLVWDLRDARTAMSMAGLAVSTALVIPSLWLVPVHAAWAGLWQLTLATAQLLAHWGIALATLLAARYIFLDAQGLVTRVRRKRHVKLARQTVAETSPPAESSQDSDAASATAARRWRWLAWPARRSKSSPGPQPSENTKSGTKRKRVKPTAEHGLQVVADAPATTPRTNERRQTASELPETEDDFDAADQSDSQRLSKAERRKQRKDKRRHQRAA